MILHYDLQRGCIHSLTSKPFHFVAIDYFSSASELPVQSKKVSFILMYFNTSNIAEGFGETLVDLGEFIWEGIKDIANWFGDVLEDVVDIIGDVAEAVGDAVGGVVRWIGGWFGKSK